jgi:hypothetical protein
VHGTPVYDIKPFVPWDIPGYYDNRRRTTNDNNNNHNNANDDTTLTTTPPPPQPRLLLVNYRIPHWVGRDDDELSHVIFTTRALEQLQQVVEDGRLAPLYTTMDDSGLEAARQTLEQVLAQDPRSSHKGVRTSPHQQRGSKVMNHASTSTTTTTTTTTTSPFRLYFGSTGVDFVVNDSGVVQVLAVTPVEFPTDAYTDGIPLATFMT